MQTVLVIVKDVGPAVACVAVVLYTYLRFANKLLNGDGNGTKGLLQVHERLDSLASLLETRPCISGHPLPPECPARTAPTPPPQSEVPAWLTPNTERRESDACDQ